MSRVAIVGAGRIGRGFLAQLAQEGGHEIVLLERDHGLVEALNARRRYSLHLLGTSSRRLVIDRYRAVAADDWPAAAQAVAESELVMTTVGARNVEAVAPVILAAAEARPRTKGPLDVVVCENLLDGAAVLGQAVRRLSGGAAPAGVGFVEAVIYRNVADTPPKYLAEDPLSILSEEYGTLPVDETAFLGPLPGLPGLLPVKDIRPHKQRKILLHNGSHAATAYLGQDLGHRYIHEAIADPRIAAVIRDFFREVQDALAAEHGSDPRLAAEEEPGFLIRRYSIAEFCDPIARVGREPLRKLRPNERLIGAARLVLKHGGTPRAVVAGICAGLRYRNPEDEQAEELSALWRAGGLDRVLREICGVTPGDPLYQMITDHDLSRRRTR